MSLEDKFDRIAVALERIAGMQQSALTPTWTGQNNFSALAPSQQDAAPQENTKVTRLARSVATDQGVIREQQAAAQRASAQAPSPATVTRVNDKVVNGSAEKVLSFEDMRAKLVAVKEKLGPDVSRAIMAKVGASNATTIKPEDFGRVISECNRAMA